MLRKLFWIGFILCCLTTFTICFFLFHFSTSDFDYYKKFLRRHHRCIQNNNLKNYESYQHRENVQKDIWWSKKNARSHLKITSQSSQVKLFLNNNKIDIIEELSHIYCWLQEYGNIGKSPQAYKFQAEEGMYFFPMHRFIAKDIHFACFTPTENFSWDKASSSCFLQGIATELSFFFENKTPKLQAKNLSAQLQLEESL